MLDASFMANLERALLFKLRANKLSPDHQNAFWPFMDLYFDELFDFRRNTEWLRLKHETSSLLEFPSVNFDETDIDIYKNLEPNHIFYFSLGSYSLKRTIAYLNTVEYERDFFECQKLKKDGVLYSKLKQMFGKNGNLELVRFRVPSAHKAGNINANGYRGYIAYIPIQKYVKDSPNEFQLKNYENVTDLDMRDYYFSNSIVAHFCTCKTGLRTVGGCAHITAAVVGFGRPLSYTKSQFYILDPSLFSRS